MENTDTMQNNNTEMPVAEQQGGGFGPIIGILIVVALIAFGGLYFWGSKMMNDKDMMDEEMMGGDNFELIDTTIEDGGTITEEEFNALLEQATPATGAADPTLDNALDDLGDLDALDAELDALGGQL